MGISLEAYRCRIGSFLPKCKLKVQNSDSKYFNSTTVSAELPAIYSFLLISMIISLLFYTPLAQVYLHSHCEANSTVVNLEQPLNIGKTLASGFGSNAAWNVFITLGSKILAESRFKMVTNFQSRYGIGNRKVGGVKISHWNKGPGFLQTKMPEIRNLINSFHPHILGISEANFQQEHDPNLVQLEDYDLHN